MMDPNDVITRYPGNPILTAKDIPGAHSVFNSGVAEYNGRYVMVMRVEIKTGQQTMQLAWSDDGIHWDPEPHKVLEPTEEPYLTYEEANYDPRVTKLGGTYYIMYCSENRFGAQLGLSKTEDFKTFEKVGMQAEPNNRNGVLFPEKIGGYYARLDRPFSEGVAGNMWISFSPDLIHWGQFRCVMESRRFCWDRGKIGPGAPPFRTEEGWLEIFHGTTPFCNGLVYRLGVVLLDLEQPWKVVARAEQYLLTPQTDYERHGDVDNVCFVCAALPDYENDMVRIYYGGADTCMCLATAKISDLIAFAKDG
ncbi:MAG TPA: glycoside hydrolase family 130 protein [Phycisphaerae bacterium]|nr:glycoside hydrolase family 130 protein [Phycisphaerae bacterium]